MKQVLESLSAAAADSCSSGYNNVRRSRPRSGTNRSAHTSSWARKTGSVSYNSRPMLIYCEPWPENMKTISGAVAVTCPVKTWPGSALPSSRLGFFIRCSHERVAACKGLPAHLADESDILQIQPLVLRQVLPRFLQMCSSAFENSPFYVCNGTGSIPLRILRFCQNSAIFRAPGKRPAMPTIATAVPFDIVMASAAAGQQAAAPPGPWTGAQHPAR